MPGDYDGDGVTDLAVWRLPTGRGSRVSAPFTSTSVVQWGLNGDVPVPGDYDAATARRIRRVAAVERHVVHPQSSSATPSVSFQWGSPAASPPPATTTAMGRRISPCGGRRAAWFIRTSSSGYTASLSFQWGLSGDITVPSDFDGDGTTDLAVYRPATGTWFIRPSSGAAAVQYQWGLSTDVPVPSDFDGDGKTDLAVYRPSTGEWFLWLSGANFTTSAGYAWGQPGDVPIFGRQ